MMTMPCKKGDFKCPYIVTCIARLNDPTIVGCGLPFYLSGVIDKADLEVVHRVKKSDDPLKESKRAPMEKSRRKKREKRC